MTWTDIIMYAVVLFVGVPAAFRSPVSLVLLGWWLAGMVTWWTLGHVPPLAAILLDAVAFLVIGRLIGSWADLFVAVLFAPSIYAHVVLNPMDDWAVSYGIGIIQLLTAASGAKHFRSWRDAVASNQNIREHIRTEFAKLRGRVLCWDG